MNLLGFHHLTAVSAKIRDNKQFYTDTLGLRLVKRSVNQDDVGAYHLYYADANGSPGTDITFFDWPLAPERRGTRAITRTNFRVRGLDALQWWKTHLTEKGVKAGEIVERDGRLSLDFEDPEGQRLGLIDDQGDVPAVAWDKSPVPTENQLKGLGPIMISVPTLAPTDTILQKVMNLKPVREYAHPEQRDDVVHVYQMEGGGAHSELHVAVQPELSVAYPGAGGVHHVAFRTPDAEYDTWADRLNTMGVPNSGKVDRFWFRSLYFREPNGILFEIASDGPGFAVDEPQATLGEALILPPFLEPHRDQIVKNLKPID